MQRATKNPQARYSGNNKIVYIIFSGFLALLLPLVVIAALTNQEIRPEAATSTFSFVVEPAVGTDVYFDPGTTTLTNDTPIRVMANYPAKNVVFAKIVATFDPSKIRLTSEISSNPAMTTVVQKSSMAEANANGKFTVVTASSPADTPLSGNFMLATFNISPFAGVTSGTTNINFVTNEMQIVDNNTQALPITPGNLIINFNNSVGTPLPTVPPSIVPSIFVPTNIPFPTNTKIPGVTNSPAVTKLPDNQPSEAPGDEKGKSESVGNKDHERQLDNDVVPGAVRKKLGDYNDDDKVDFKDLIDWVKGLFGLRPPEVKPNELQQINLTPTTPPGI